MSKRNMNIPYKISSILIVFILVFVALYKYGYKIPILKEIPFFSTKHQHQYRPVLSEEGEIKYWTCTMHPSVRLKEPGTCPICGMDLVSVMKKGITQTGTSGKTMEEKKETQGMQGMSGMHGMTGMTKTGDKELKSTFMVSPERQQIIGVKTQPVIVRPLERVIRTDGIVQLDETKIEHIHTKISGWIEKVFVDFQWQHVKKGDPLFTIYSPELVSTQEEFLIALRSQKLLGDSRFKDIASSSNSLVDATRRRLQLWDISNNQIKELENTGKVKKSLVIYSPVTGHVAYRNAFENMHVEPNTRIYTIADHSTVWVQVDIYENEISLVKLGQEATMTLTSYPGEEFHGKVSFIWPHLHPETRTVKVRLEFPNPDLKLLPEMYANVELKVPLGKGLTVPSSAVLRTGKQDIVFVDKAGGNFQMRRIQIGKKSGENYQVLRGLKEGEKVVSRANFLIDAESKIQAAMATWGDESDENDKAMHEMEFEKVHESQPGSESQKGHEPMHNKDSK